jgi:hypothetical protein
MFDLDKVDFFQTFKNTIILPDEDSHKPSSTIVKIVDEENEYGKIYMKTLTNAKKSLLDEGLLIGEYSKINFQSEFLVDFQAYFKSVLKIYQYKNDRIIHVRIALRILKGGPIHTEKIYSSKECSLAIQFDTISKKFKFQVKFPNGRERLTYLSFNTAAYLKQFVHPHKLSEFAMFLLKTSSNEFILKSENMDFIRSLFDNKGDGFVVYNLDAQKLSKVTNPTSLYRYLTGYKNINKNLLKFSLKKAVIFSTLIKEEDQQKFFNGIENSPPDDDTIANPAILNGLRGKKSEIEEFVNYYQFKLNANQDIIRDYILLAKNLAEKLNLDISTARRLKEEHDKFDKKQRALKIPQIKTHEHYKNVLQSTDLIDVELINDRERLAEESMIMNHCVYSYYDRINNGSCAIFSIKIKNNSKNRWTLELRSSNNESTSYKNNTERTVTTITHSYIIGQLRGYNNDRDPITEAPQSVRNELLNQLGTILEENMDQVFDDGFGE